MNESQSNLLFGISHVCIGELNELAVQIEDLDIDLIGAGHCNELLAQQLGSSVMLGGGSRFTTYAKASHFLDRSGNIADVAFSTYSNLAVEESFESGPACGRDHVRRRG